MFPSPTAAFAALSARSSGPNNFASDVGEIEQFIRSGDDKNATLAIDRRLRSLENMGLAKAEKISLDTVPIFKLGDDVYKFIDTLHTGFTKAGGGVP